MFVGDSDLETGGDPQLTPPAVGPAVIELMAAVESVARAGLSADCDELRAVRLQLDRLTALVAEAEVRFDHHQVWREEGAASLRGWLMANGGLSRREAGRVASRADRLGAWPAVATAWRSGALSGAQVDAMVGIVPARFVGLFAEHAPGVIAAIGSFDVMRTERALRQWVRMAEVDDGPEHFRDRTSIAHASTLMDGSLSVSAVLHGADAAEFDAALRVFDVPDSFDDRGEPIGPSRTHAQRVAESLMAMARCALAHRDGPGEHARFVPHVSLLIDVVELRAASLRAIGVSTLADLARVGDERGWSAAERADHADALSHHGECITTDGVVIDSSSMSALCCDSVVQRVITSGSRVLDLGREVRTATPQQRRAVVARDRHCRAPGCRTRTRHCEVHHLQPWVLGGRTDLDNLVLLCGAHHREFHRGGHSTKLSTDGRFTVRAPNGWSGSTIPESEVELVFPRAVA